MQRAEILAVYFLALKSEVTEGERQHQGRFTRQAGTRGTKQICEMERELDCFIQSFGARVVNMNNVSKTEGKDLGVLKQGREGWREGQLTELSRN